MNNCHIGLSVDNEIVITRTHKTGKTILVIDADGDIMVSFASNEHPDKGWRVFKHERLDTLKEIFDLFNKEHLD